MGALSNIKILDLSRVLAGPSCTQVLADLGATVIKIERPKIGDETRQWIPPAFSDGSSAYFSTVNRNKLSVTVDISTSEGQQIIHRLAQEADVLVENYKVGSLKKYHLDYETLNKINPQLIYASLTGFGQDGPDAHKPGYDYIIQGLSGLMSITGPSDGKPHKVGVAVVDLFAGLQLTIGIQAALLHRIHSQKGQWIDISLLDSAIALTGNVGMNALASGSVPPRLGNEHPNIVPYQVFESAQQRHFILACGNDAQFAMLCRAMGQNWHLDGRFTSNPLRVKNRHILQNLMQEAFLREERDYWLALFESVQVPCGAIHNIQEALNMPQVEHREMILSFENSPVKCLGNPIKLSDSPVEYRRPPPTLGQDTDMVLSQYFDEETLMQWHQKGIV